LRWGTFADCILKLARELEVRRMLFVGSFGGPVPHTREPRLHVTCSEAEFLPEMEKYGLRRTAYEGPGSFASYLLTRASAVGLRMASLAAEIPGYLQGPNPVSIEAVTRRLAKILRLPLDLAPLRAASTAVYSALRSGDSKPKAPAERRQAKARRPSIDEPLSM